MRVRLGLSLFALFCSIHVNAQAVNGFGSVTGIVLEGGTNDGLPDATVVLSNDAMGLRRTMVTTDEGVFDAPALVPAAGYRLKITKKGFADYEVNSFEVTVGQILNFKISVDAGTTAAHVESTNVLKPVDDTKSGVATQVNRKQLDNLPDNGRQLDSLILLAPASTQDRTSGVLSFRGEPATTTILADGNDTTNTYFLQTPAIAPRFTLDAVEDFQVLSAAGPAEFERGMGGIVNAVTRSGSANFHGNLYDYWMNNSFSAADRYAPGFQPNDHQNQLGASLGGPILRGKNVFFFANFEAIDGSSLGDNRITNQLIANPLGTAVLASNCKATAAQCAAAEKFIDAQMNVAVPRSLHSLTGLAKVDYRRSERNSFTVEADATHTRAPNGVEDDEVTANGGLLGANGTYTGESRFARAAWTSVFSGMGVNQMRGNWYQDRLSEFANSDLLPSTKSLGIDIAGTSIGANPAFPSSLREQRYQFVDDFTWTTASQSLKLGTDLARSGDYVNQLLNRYGTYNYPTLTAFAEDFSSNSALLKDYASFTQTFGNPIAYLHAPVISFYGQDTWKVTPRFTVTGGIRFEKMFVPQPTQSNSAYYETATIPAPDTNFSPRVGLAYMADPKTVIRFGFGYYYQPLPGQLLNALFTDNGIYQTSLSVNPNQKGALAFPNIFPTVGSIPAGTENVVFASTKLRDPYTQQGTLAIERRVAKNTNVTATYIYSHGISLWNETDQNLAAPTVSASYLIETLSGAKNGTYSTQVWTGKSNSAYAHAYQVGNEGRSQYNGLALQVQQRMSHGFSGQLSYTWSHAIDNVSGPAVIGFVPAGSVDSVPGADNGNSAFDQRHRMVANWTWEPTILRNTSALARYVVNGWRISGILTIASSLPETAVVQVIGLQGLAMDYTTSLNGSGGWGRVPFLPVGSLLTGAEYNASLRLTRTIPFTERVQGLLMFEAFNAFNTQYNTGVNTIAYTATSGTIVPVAGAGEGNAAGGLPDGTNARRAQLAFRVTF